MNYEILAGFVVSTAVLSVSPGPDNIFVLTQSMVNGKKHGLATVAGLMSGCLVHTTLLAFGVSAIIKNTPTVFLMIKLFGVAYLLYLSFQVFKSDGSIGAIKSSEKEKGLSALFYKGFLMNVLNPKVTIFFLAFFPGFLFSDTMGEVQQFYTLGLLFICVSSIVFGGIALMAGSISTYITQKPKSGIYLKWLQITVFLGIAVYLLLSYK